MVDRNRRIRFMDNQLATTATITVSSELSGFPAANLLNQSRSKIFKFAGNFYVPANQSVIYFNDGSNKSVTIASGTYTAASLASSIQSLLNGISSNWTCTYSTTNYKFTIDRSSGTKTLRKSVTTNAAWDLLGYVGSTDEDAGEADEQRNHTSEYIQVDLGTNGNAIQFMGLIGPISDVFNVSEDATITLKGTNILDFDTPEFSRSCTRFSDGLFEFLDNETDTYYRYWRLEIVDRQNTVGPEGFILSFFYLGTYLTLNNRNVNTGFTKQWVDNTDIQTSEQGTEYFKTRQRYLALRNSSINYLDASDRAELEQFFYDVGIHTPFFISFDPLQNCTDDITELTKYVRFDGSPNFNHFRNSIYSMTFAVREAL